VKAHFLRVSEFVKHQKYNNT